MAKLVVHTESLKGLTHELKVERTTVGRVDDNTFQIVEASVSSHHAEILLKGTDVVVKDLNSTNGTFINGERITEATLKPGQTLRLGNVEIKVDGLAAAKKQLDATMVIPQGVKRDELGTSIQGTKLNEKAGFHRKSNNLNRVFFIGGGITLLIIIGLIVYAVIQQGAPHE